MAKKRKKLKLAPKAEVTILRPENDPDTVLDQCKGVFESVLVIGWRKDGLISEHYTQNLNEPDMLMLIEQYKLWLLTGGGEDE